MLPSFLANFLTKIRTWLGPLGRRRTIGIAVAAAAVIMLLIAAVGAVRFSTPGGVFYSVKTGVYETFMARFRGNAEAEETYYVTLLHRRLAETAALAREDSVSGTAQAALRDATSHDAESLKAFIETSGSSDLLPIMHAMEEATAILGAQKEIVNQHAQLHDIGEDIEDLYSDYDSTYHDLAGLYAATASSEEIQAYMNDLLNHVSDIAGSGKLNDDAKTEIEHHIENVQEAVVANDAGRAIFEAARALRAAKIDQYRTQLKA